MPFGARLTERRRAFTLLYRESSPNCESRSSHPKSVFFSPIFVLARYCNINILCIGFTHRHAFRLHHRLGLLPRPVLCGAHREHSPAAWSSQPRPRTLNRPVQTMAITNRDLLHQLGPCRRFRAVPENWLRYRFSSKAVSLTSFQAPRPTPSVAALRKERTARIRIAPDEFPPKCRQKSIMGANLRRTASG